MWSKSHVDENAALFQYSLRIQLSSSDHRHRPSRQSASRVSISRGGGAHSQVDGRVSVADRAQVAFEVADVHGVEADDGDEQADVGLGQPVADEVVLVCQDLLESVETFKDHGNGGGVGFLGGREADFVDAICVSLLACDPARETKRDEEVKK